MGFLFVLCCFLSLIHHLLHSQQSCVYGDDVKTHSNWQTTSKILLALTSRDRLVVRTLRCGRSNPGSNPGHGINILTIQLVKKKIKIKNKNYTDMVFLTNR